MGNVALVVYFILVPILGGLVSGFITPTININEKMPRDITFTGGIFHTFIAILWFNNYLIFIQNPLLILQSIFVISILIILILSCNFYSQKYSYRYGVNLRFRIQSN